MGILLAGFRGFLYNSKHGKRVKSEICDENDHAGGVGVTAIRIINSS